MREVRLTGRSWQAMTGLLVMGGVTLIMSSAAVAQVAPAPPVLSEVSTNDATALTAEGTLATEYDQLLANVSQSACGGTAACGCDACNTCCSWCNLGEAFKLSDVFKDDCGNSALGSIDVGGWTQIGYHDQNNGMFNNHESRVRAQQVWLYAEKVANGECGWDWGFRVDAMYGTDAADTQSFGNNGGVFDFAADWNHGIYGWAMPQLYGEIANGDLSVKLGHFYTLVGYEVVTAPDNFFYSHAYTMYNSEPFTHTGALATYKLSDCVEVYGGWTLGWDTGFDQLAGGSNFLGGVSVSVTDDITATYITTIGDLGWREEGYAHSLVVDVALTDDLNYVAQTDLVETNAANDHQVGLNQYLLYTVNDCLSVGGRMEWWKSAGVSHYEATFGLNIRPHANLVIRPEVRQDWAPGGNSMVGNGADSDNFTTWGIDAVVTY